MLFRRVFPGLFLLLAAPIAAVAGTEGGATAAATEQEAAGEVAEAPTGGDFSLTSADGPVSLLDFRGRVVMLYFGYTACPDVCPTSIAYLGSALRGLSDDELARVQPLFVSVDPVRDTPEKLKEYVDYFDIDMLGLTGREADIARVAELYGVKYYEVELQGSAFGFAVNHSAALYLIDSEGALRFVFPHQTPPEVMTEAIRYVLAGN
ncbi:MAG: SCO family protein [Pseudomonadota bacterium]|nr:SCO family protein [Pseudomonadota bacterium]